MVDPAENNTEEKRSENIISFFFFTVKRVFHITNVKNKEKIKHSTPQIHICPGQVVVGYHAKNTLSVNSTELIKYHLFRYLFCLKCLVDA